MLRLSMRAPRGARVVQSLKTSVPRRQHTAAGAAGAADAAADLGQQKQREQALAAALAREEEAMLRVKALRELQAHTHASVHALNAAAAADVGPRLAALQRQLDRLPQHKVQQLDEQIEDFLFHSMRLPPSEVADAPWTRAAAAGAAGGGSESGPKSESVQSRSTASAAHAFPRLRPTPDYKAYSEQELFLRHMAHVTRCGALGSAQTGIYEPSADTERPRAVADLTLAQLMAAECHLGHARALWRPSTQPFIYGEYNGVHLIDLNHTLAGLRKAARVARAVAAKGGIILYVGTARLPEQQHALEEAARRSNAYCVTHRWIPGTITNFTEVSRQLAGPQTAAVDLGDAATGKTYTTAEGTLVKPDLIVLMNPVANRNCIGESIKSRIPTIGLCDTDMEPSLLTYPIPCNDDSMRASSLILGVLSKAAQEGVQERHRVFAEYKKKGTAGRKDGSANARNE